MRIGLTNFRCFFNVSPVDIRPITLLVGENSTGKSSFLAGLRFVNELFQRGSDPSFNKDPYSLGSFKEIAHYRGGRAGRADQFSFNLSLPVRLTRRTGEDRLVELCVTLREVNLQAAVSQIELKADDYSLFLSLGKTLDVSVKTPTMPAVSNFSDQLRLPLGFTTPNLSAVSFLLSDIGYMIHSNIIRRKNRPNTEIPESEFFELDRLLRATERSFPSRIFASAPVRTKPARTYDNVEAPPSPEGSHIPHLLARLKAFDPADWERLQERLIDFGNSSGLFHEIDVKRFSSSPSSPFQISVNIAGPSSNLMDVGYGVSQALPFVVETLQAQRGSMFLLQQPEVHLHPRAQAALGTYLGVIARQRRLTMVVETHSDFIVDRLRMDVRDRKIDPGDITILFFERQGLDVSIIQLAIDELGNILDAPPSYRSFFLAEQLRALQ